MRKSPSTDPGSLERRVMALARWVDRRWRGFVSVTAALLALLVLAAWVEPQRSAPATAAETAERTAARARAEAALVALPVKVARDGVMEISFKSLAFFPPADIPGPAAGGPGFARQAPDRIRALDHHHIRITGYMLPTRNEQDGTREFVILRSQLQCCYGIAPRFCDYVMARMQDAPTTSPMDRPVTFEGTLHVADVYVNGYWTALYSLDCTKATR